jgi:hypothetical protein
MFVPVEVFLGAGAGAVTMTLSTALMAILPNAAVRVTRPVKVLLVV